MRTNLVLDDDLIAEALRLSGIKMKKDLVHEREQVPFVLPVVCFQEVLQGAHG